MESTHQPLRLRFLWNRVPCLTHNRFSWISHCDYAGRKATTFPSKERRRSAECSVTFWKYLTFCSFGDLTSFRCDSVVRKNDRGPGCAVLIFSLASIRQSKYRPCNATLRDPQETNSSILRLPVERVQRFRGGSIDSPPGSTTRIDLLQGSPFS